MTVQRVPPSGVSLSVQPPGGQATLGDHLVLSCTVAKGAGALSFSWHQEDLGALLGSGSRLELHHLGDTDISQYQCRLTDGDSVAESDPLNVTILGARMPQDRSPQPVSLSGPPRVSPSPAPPWDLEVTNTELSGPCEGQRDSRDYDDML